jgi:hypothetical protein
MVKIIRWEEVKKIHKVISGVSVKNKKIRSLLCSKGKNNRYPNQIFKNEIIYYVDGSTMQGGITALINSIGTDHTFPVFHKLGVNQWINLGDYKIACMNQEDKLYISFQLLKQ